MITKVFALLDTKVGVFNTPFFMLYEGSAIRACVDLGGDLSTVVGRHPGDYMLCELGSFDDQTGVLHHIPPRQIGMVASFLPARGQFQGSAPLFEDEKLVQALAKPADLTIPPAPSKPNGHA